MTNNQHRQSQHQQQPRRDQADHVKTDEDDSKLERLAKKIVPPGHDVTNDELKDPGSMTPDVPPTDNRS